VRGKIQTIALHILSFLLPQTHNGQQVATHSPRHIDIILLTLPPSITHLWVGMCLYCGIKPTIYKPYYAAARLVNIMLVFHSNVFLCNIFGHFIMVSVANFLMIKYIILSVVYPV